MVALSDMLELHVVAGIELRLVTSLWPLHDLAVSDRWDFSIVRMPTRSHGSRCRILPSDRELLRCAVWAVDERSDRRRTFDWLPEQ